MADKMQRFTQRARRVLSLAQEEAERLQHSYIGTEHLLLGLMREEGGVAGRVLKQLGLDIKEVEALVERKTRSGQRAPFSKLDLSPGTKKVLELAVEEARRMGHHYIGTEHLLLALLRYNEGVAIDVLKAFYISVEQIRKETFRVLQDSPSTPRPPAPRPARGRERAKEKSAKLERFSDSAHDVLSFAEKEAIRLKRDTVTTEFLLLGLLKNENDAAARLLLDLGLDVKEVESAIEGQNSGGGEAPDKLQLSAGTQAVLRLALYIATELGLRSVDTEYLLLALVSRNDDSAIEILRNFNITPEQVWKQVHAEEVKSPRAPPQRTIVFIYEEPAMLDLAALLQTSRGITVFAASSAQVGLELVRAHTPDVVVLNPTTGVGWEVYGHMRSDKAMRIIPVIMATATAPDIEDLIRRIRKVPSRRR